MMKNTITSTEIDGLKKQLESALTDIKTTLKHLTTESDFGNDVDDLDEETDESEEFANQLNVKNVLVEKTKNIEDALAKIKSGSYGLCEKCGKGIAIEVLHALPESRLCRNCKQKER